MNKGISAEDLNKNGTLDPGEDANSNGMLDFSRIITMSERATLTNNNSQDIQFGSGRAASEDRNGNGVLDIGEDINSNGLLDNGPRVMISNNFTGIRLESGKVRVVNTEVRDNVLNGIEVGLEGAPAAAPSLQVVIGEGLSRPTFKRLVEGAIDLLNPNGAKLPYIASIRTIKLNNVLPIAENMAVTGRGIATGTTVEKVDLSTNEVTLSADTILDIVDQSELTFEGSNPKIRSEASNAILSNGQYGIRFLESVEFLEEDTNGDGTINDTPFLNIGVDSRPVILQGNYVGKEHQGVFEPGNLRANYHAENIGEDANENGLLDPGEDTNGNGPA